MIYLDHAATTGVKPEPVRRAVMQALMTLSANPGRSGAGPSLKAAKWRIDLLWLPLPSFPSALFTICSFDIHARIT